MDKKYLLTYDKEIKVLEVSQGTIPTYVWFDDEDEMNDFIKEENINVTEKMYISEANQL